MSKCKFKVGDYVICNKSDFWSINKGWIGQVKSVLPTGKITLAGNGCVLTTDKINCFDLYIKDQPNKIVITTDGKTTTAKMYRDKTLVKVETAECHPDDRFDFMVGAKVAFDRLVGEKKEEPTLKIEIGKKYKIKDYNDVNNHCSLSRWTWEEIQNAGAVTVSECISDGQYLCSTGYRGNWVFYSEAFECEWEEPTYYNGKVVCVETRVPCGLIKGKIYTFIDGTATNEWGGQVTRDRVVDFNDLVSRFPTVDWLEVVE